MWSAYQPASTKDCELMLVLSRKPGERILIGEEVSITIVRIGPKTVRLGFDAPRDMNIVREELLPVEEAIGGQQTLAAA
jgi:carbon storage regulator